MISKVDCLYGVKNSIYITNYKINTIEENKTSTKRERNLKELVILTTDCIEFSAIVCVVWPKIPVCISADGPILVILEAV